MTVYRWCDSRLEKQNIELLLIILKHPVCLKETRDRAGSLAAELEAQMEKRQVKAARARAEAMRFEAVVEEVLDQTEMT